MMKREEEEYCKAKFDEYLKGLGLSLVIKWCPVAQKDEPPDYYLYLYGDKYAVEVTVLVESINVGTLKLSRIAILRYLYQFVKDIELEAKRRNILHGTYVVTIHKPIENFDFQKDIIQNNLFSYIDGTQNFENAPKFIAYDVDRQTVKIQKANNKRNTISLLPIVGKREWEMAIDISNILEEAIIIKKGKLGKINLPKILILYDAYNTASKDQYFDCLSKLPLLASFHTIFVVSDFEGNFVLYTENADWLSNPNTNSGYTSSENVGN
jgi:hypothetical protein